MLGTSRGLRTPRWERPARLISSPSWARDESFSADWALDTLKVDAPHLGGRGRTSAFGAHVIERGPHLFEIDLLPAWHGPEILVQIGKNRGMVGGNFEGGAQVSP
jgi:hypothetical protein